MLQLQEALQSGRLGQRTARDKRGSSCVSEMGRQESPIQVIMTGNELHVILSDIMPAIIGVIALFQAMIARSESKQRYTENKKRLLQHSEKFDKVENALYDSPAINGPYKKKPEEETK